MDPEWLELTVFAKFRSQSSIYLIE
jgi:hypothetical protein